MSVPAGLSRWIGSLPPWLSGSVSVAVGAEERNDPVLGRTGGPAGNARLTAWTGIVLLVLFAAEGATLIDLGPLISWHIAVGAALIPPTLLKVISTGWRMVSYYAASRPYRAAGPPPLLLRTLGPLVVLSTGALLTTGVLLILLGQTRSRSSLGSFGPFQVDWIWLHQASFVVWLVFMTLHVLGRLLPGLRIVGQAVGRPSGVPGLAMRLVTLVAVAALGAGCAVLLIDADSTWTHGFGHHHHHH